MTDYKEQQIDEAGPSVPVEIMGLDAAPMSGDEFNAVSNERLAKSWLEQRKALTQRKRNSSFAESYA